MTDFDQYLGICSRTNPKYVIGAPNKCFITAQKMKFSINDIFSKCDQIRSLQKTSSFVQ